MAAKKARQEAARTILRRALQKPTRTECVRAPRLVVVGQSILTIQGRLTTITKRQDTLQTEFDRLDEEKGVKLQDLSLLQREMDKLTSAHHVVQQ